MCHFTRTRSAVAGHKGPDQGLRELVQERRFSAVARVLADVKNQTKMRQIFERYRPSVVFHAIVPLFRSMALSVPHGGRTAG